MIPWPGIVAFVVALAAGVCIGISVLGGWAELARFYRHHGRFNGRRDRFESLRMGQVHYNLCAVLGMNSDGLFLSVMLPFRLWHPPLLIPWRELSLEWKKSSFFKLPYLDVRARQVPACSIRIYAGSFARLLVESASQHMPAASATQSY